MAIMRESTTGGTVKTSTSTKNGVTNYSNPTYGFNAYVANTKPTTQTSNPTVNGISYTQKDLKNIYNGGGGSSGSGGKTQTNVQSSVDYNDYYEKLMELINEQNSRSESLAREQNDLRLKRIAEYLEEALGRQNSMYRRQRKAIEKSSGNMNGAKLSALARLANGNNNVISEINRNADNLRADSNISLSSALLDATNNKYNNKFNALTSLARYL